MNHEKNKEEEYRQRLAFLYTQKGCLDEAAQQYKILLEMTTDTITSYQYLIKMAKLVFFITS